MTFRPKERSPDDSPGLRRELYAFVAAASDQFRTRSELFGLEAREAAQLCGRKVVCAVIALTLFATGYLLIIASLIGLIGSLLAGHGLILRNWTGAGLLVALLHLVAGFLFLRKVRSSPDEPPLFSATLSELRKDQQWLEREKNN